jgi:hypothetical protein
MPSDEPQRGALRCKRVTGCIGNIFNLGADIGAMGLAITAGYLLT